MQAINLRKFGLTKRQIVDDRPYGGGVGMVLRPDVLYKAIKSVKKGSRVILLTPQGQKFNQKVAQRLAKYNSLAFICGRYEGFDERIRSFVDEEISIGDYVLMGGELPALVIAEAVMRLRPGILGKLESTANESFSQNGLEYPQYTKPYEFKVRSSKLKVPKILLTGNHKRIAEWRINESMKRTKKRRPDL